MNIRHVVKIQEYSLEVSLWHGKPTSETKMCIISTLIQLSLSSPCKAVYVHFVLSSIPVSA